MRIIRLLATTLLLITAVAYAPTHVLAQSSTDDAGVHHWLDDFTRAFQAKDTNAIMALYAPDVIAYDITPPLQYIGLDSYRKDWSAYFAAYKGPLAIEFRDLHIYTSGDLALVTCLQHVNGTLNNGQTISIWLRVTTGLRRVNGRWLDFHDHVSVPTDFATGKSMIDLQP